MKVKCSGCKENKNEENFGKDKSNKNELTSYCKVCKSKISKERRRTLRGKIHSTFNQQIHSSIKRNHEPPSYSKAQFYDWCINSVKFIGLFKQWKDSGFKKDLAPSIDRNDDYLPYSFKNIKVCIWKENNERSHNDVKNGINNKRNIEVNQICKTTGKTLNTFYSISEASRITGVPQPNINNCFNGKLKSAGGYYWK